MSDAYNDKGIYISKKGLMYTVAAIGIVIATAAVASYATKQQLITEQAQEAPKPAPKKVVHRAAPTQQHQQVAQTQPACDDNNIVGTAVGGVGGGIVGSQIGKGSGKTVATIGGALGGAYLGNQFIPTRNVTCK